VFVECRILDPRRGDSNLISALDGMKPRTNSFDRACLVLLQERVELDSFALPSCSEDSSREGQVDTSVPPEVGRCVIENFQDRVLRGRQTRRLPLVLQHETTTLRLRPNDSPAFAARLAASRSGRILPVSRGWFIGSRA